MNVFAINLLLAAGWAALSGAFTVTTLGVGFLLGFVALWIARPLFPEESYFVRLPRLLKLTAIFLRELVLSSIRVAGEVLRPTPASLPGIVAVPMRSRNDTELLLVSSLVTLTPGTLSLDVTEDGLLYVHAMFVEDADELRREIAETIERPALEALA